MKDNLHKSKIYGLYKYCNSPSKLNRPQGYDLHKNIKISSNLFGLKTSLYWNVITLGKARSYILTDEKGGIAHYSFVMPKCYKFPFMRSQKSGDIEIGPCFTREKDRGRGLYPYVISQIANSHNKCGAIYMVIHNKNTSSIIGVEKAGFKRRQSLKKTIFKSFIIIDDRKPEKP